MAESHEHNESTDVTPVPGDVEPGSISHRSAEDKVAVQGHPVDRSKTGGTNATKYIYTMATADYASMISVTVNLVPYLFLHLHQPVAKAATITSNYTGTCYLLSVFGGFIADSYLGHYFTVIIGAVVQILGLSVLVFSSNYSDLQPPSCAAPGTPSCPPAGTKYMAPLFVAIYTIALGTGLIKSNNSALGAEQFDESDPVEKNESSHFFIWYYFFQNIGLLLAFTLSVYLINFVNRGWGFGWLLILFAVSMAIFLFGTPRYRHRVVGGSFLTRVVQVWVAAIRKAKLRLPEDPNQLYDAPIAGSWINNTNKLRFLDKGAIIDKHQEGVADQWRLAGVTQVEETKRILLLLPVWLSAAFISLIFPQVVTFTVTQGSTLNRSMGPHFVLPPASLGTALVLMSLLGVPVYDKVFVPIARRFTKTPYGLSPLKRIGIASVIATMAMISAALVERKRLHYIRELGYTESAVFELPMRMWWLLPQYFFSAMTELFLLIAQSEFFYQEVSDATRSIGSSFLLSGLSLGNYLSSVLVNITNRVTKHHSGGAWLEGRLNNGGLENYFWLLSGVLAVNFVVFLIVAHFYEYNYKTFVHGSEAAVIEDIDHKEREVEAATSGRHHVELLL